MNVNDRVKAIINDLYAGNKSAFAKAVGVNPTVIENIVGARQGKPSYEVIEKLCANANVSPEWLILEKGSMIIDESVKITGAQNVTGQNATVIGQQTISESLVREMLAEKDATIRSLLELLSKK